MIMALCHLIQNNLLFYLKPHMTTVYILYNCIGFWDLLCTRRRETCRILTLLSNFKHKKKLFRILFTKMKGVSFNDNTLKPFDKNERKIKIKDVLICR